MSTQSSAAVMFRGLVMLGCLITIPLVAVFGKSLPDVFNSLLQGQWPSQLPWSEPAPESFHAAQPAGRAPAEGGISPTWSQMTDVPTGVTASRWQVVPADYQSPVDPSAARFPEPARGSEMGSEMVENPQLRPLSGAPGVLTAPPMEGRFAAIQDRLRQLGATYYLLESWGSREYLYRFYCKVAVGGNPDYTHFFEATHRDPLEAMGEVLRQVEAWRAARQ